MSTLNVPHHYKTIQAAINAAHSGDTIMIKPGIYHESLQIIKKNISICWPTLEASSLTEKIKLILALKSTHITSKSKECKSLTL